ncbi:hypothetical protein MMYC01_209255 [Madurella mycetomatis]|uniref:Uncharacterized protein n=1 Tax=Madurella mycetomatis TaxID=100816 RepID=A0A175VTW3_9PEZI|nr:hypothetical protein MMYC01_209255 [Madurella mycetomatis]
MLYFNSITNISAFNAKYSSSRRINELREIPAASSWSTKQLVSARLIIRTARPNKKCGHMLPALRKYFDQGIHNNQQIRELMKGPDFAEDHALTKIEFLHKYGASLGPIWASLVKFGDVPVDTTNDEDETKSNVDDIDDIFDKIEGIYDMIEGIGDDESNARKRKCTPGSEDSEPVLPVAPAKRIRKEPHRPGFVSSETMKVASSSPAKESSQQSQVSSTGHVDAKATSADIPEQATVQIASSFITLVLQACPSQNDTYQCKPERLVEFSDVTRQLTGYLGNGEKFHATADGELVLYELDNGTYKLTSCRPALLEAKKCFKAIEDGKPVITDGVLGQMTGEALALRLQLEQGRFSDEE